jgi:hypothetical protein
MFLEIIIQRKRKQRLLKIMSKYDKYIYIYRYYLIFVIYFH